ncbi:MAG: InlB B-repeat-containing protein [Firmicutes bacterium]|nr:InlB B-repeat-containing protein [Bacillota bacterium]
MSKNCLNCGCEISGEGKNKIFCDDCLSKVSPFLKFVSKSPTPAMKLYELNVGKLRAQGFSEDALKYIEKCCTRYDEKHAASAAAATAAASAAVINDIDAADEPLGKNSSVVTGDDGGIEISGGAQGGAGYGNNNADVNPDDPLIAAALSALEASSAANAANAANAAENVTPPTNDGLSFDGLNFENTLDNEATSIYGAVGAASAAGAAGAAGAAVSSGGYGGGGHRPREFDEGEVGHSDMDRHRLLYIYILLGVAAILLIIFLIIFISGRSGGNDDETSNTSGSGNVADVTTTADDTTVADDSSYADDTTGEGETTGADDTTGTDDTTSADDTTAADDTTTADDTTAADVTTADNGTTTYYTVSFNLNYDGATGAPANQIVASGSTATTPTSPTRTGYTFSGWYLRDGTKYNFSTAVSSDVTLYAHWATSTYTVTFNLNYTGATGTPASQSVSYGGTVAAPTSPTRTGYTFTGWYTSMTGNTVYDFSSSVTSDLTLYAHWSANVYTVSFDLNYTGATGAPTSQSVSYGSTATAPTSPTRDGYTFAGWYTSASGGSAYSFSTTVTGDITLYAHWTEESASTYTVSFNMNYLYGFSGASNVPSDQTVEEGECATEPTDVPTLTGCHFEGWYTSAACDTLYDFSTAVTGNITLYAKWTADYFTVTFNLAYSGGTAPSSQTVRYGLTVREPDEPTWDGHTFLGWYLVTNATEPYDFSTPVTESFALYAQWGEVDNGTAASES